MTRRANRLVGRTRDWIPSACRVADVGSGTGHNARELRTELGVTVDEFDVADLHWIGSGPVLFNGLNLPAVDSSYSIVTLFFVLHYLPNPVQFLQEMRRVSTGRIIVIQSTYRGVVGRVCLRLREFLWGPVAFYFARLAGIIQGQSCPLIAINQFSRRELSHQFHQAGLAIQHCERQEWWGLQVSRDLYVLEPITTAATSPSLSPREMKSAG